MKKNKLKLSKKVVKDLKLKLKKVSDRKAAPYLALNPSNGDSC